mgnify:CR=1 FL=1
MTDPPKRSNEDAGRTMDEHRFQECNEPHLFRRMIHCKLCGENESHPNHEEVKS